MVKTFLFIPTTLLAFWLAVSHNFNSTLTTVSRIQTEKLSVFDSDYDYQIKTIVIDAGHGGRDGGCSGASSREKVLNLKIAKKVKSTIEANIPGIQVIMTREKDVFIPLHKRAKIANENEADLFLSIHCNSIRNANHIHGSESYVLGLHKAERNLEVVKRENDVVYMEEDYEKNYGLDPNSPAGHIMMSAFQNAHLEQSILFAEKIEAQIKIHTPHKSRGVKQAGFFVLRETTMPSVLLETGYLTNKKDEGFLLTEKGQNYIATAVVNALIDYKNQVETGIASHEPVKQFVKAKDASADKKINTPKPKKNTGYLNNSPNRHQEYAKTQKENSKSKETPSSKIKVIKETPVAQKPKVSFRVQVAASRVPLKLNERKLNNSGYSVQIVKESKMLKYQAGDFTNFTAAAKNLKSIRKLGFSDAFIVSYNQNRKISLKQAKELTGE